MGLYFSNWIIYVTVKLVENLLYTQVYFSNWIIYVTVKQSDISKELAEHFSNWIIYVTVKPNLDLLQNRTILVTE